MSYGLKCRTERRKSAGPQLLVAGAQASAFAKTAKVDMPKKPKKLGLASRVGFNILPPRLGKGTPFHLFE
jgi:hypothetical protein